MLYRIPDDMPGRFITLGNFTAIRALVKPTATVEVK
jgi:hypothetical protein